jgi:hypothetical protein
MSRTKIAVVVVAIASAIAGIAVAETTEQGSEPRLVEVRCDPSDAAPGVKCGVPSTAVLRFRTSRRTRSPSGSTRCRDVARAKRRVPGRRLTAPPPARSAFAAWAAHQ